MIDPSLPGAPPFPPDLAPRLAAAYASKGSRYAPRTHHLDGGRPRFTNRLILESSPYLLQHAHNPVSWWAWGEVTDDPEKKTEGNMDKAKGKLEDVKGSIKNKIDDIRGK